MIVRASRNNGPYITLTSRRRWYITHAWPYYSSHQIARTIGANAGTLRKIARELGLPKRVQLPRVGHVQDKVRPLAGLKVRCQGCGQIGHRCA